MLREIEDIKRVCKNIVERSENIKNLVTELKSIIDEIKSKTDQEEAVKMTLAIKKELTNLFILNSNMEDSFRILQKIFSSIKKLNKIP